MILFIVSTNLEKEQIAKIKYVSVQNNQFQLENGKISSGNLYDF
jgi:hypothetical protein